MLTLRFFLLSQLIVLILGACSSGNNPSPSDSGPATIDAAVVATDMAQADTDATIAAAVAATIAAEADTQAVVDEAVQATATAIFADLTAQLPTSTPAERAAMDESQLAALVEETMSVAAQAVEQSASGSISIAVDDAVTPQEAQTVAVYLASIEQALTQTEIAVESYTSQYGELATGAVAELAQIEDNLAAAVDVLNDINNTINQTTATVDQVQIMAQSAVIQAQQVQNQIGQWGEIRQGDIQKRVADVMAVQPTTGVGSTQELLQQAQNFIALSQELTADNRLSSPELQALAQESANLRAGLAQSEATSLQSLADPLANLTQRLAAGDIQAAQGQLNTLSQALDVISSGGQLEGDGSDGGRRRGN